MTFVGADVDQLRALAGRFESEAATIDFLRSRITSLVHSSGWDGRDAAQFRTDWQRWMQPALARAATYLHDGNHRLSAQAAAQESTSRSDGGGARDMLRGIDSRFFAGGGGGGGGWTDPERRLSQTVTADSYAGLTGHLPTGVTVSRDGFLLDTRLEGEARISGDIAMSTTEGLVTVGVAAGGSATAAAATGTSLRVGRDGIAYRTGVSARAEIEAHVSETARVGAVTATVAAGTSVGARGDIGGHASVNADGVAAGGGVSAFAGAEAHITDSVDIGGAEVEATAGLRAGLGLDANADVSATMDEVSAHVNLGAAIGIGGSIGFDVKFHPREMLSHLPKFGF